MMESNNWVCSKCNKEYSYNEYMKLSKVELVKNKSEEYGYTPVCTCGNVFHKQRWNHVTCIRPSFWAIFIKSIPRFIVSTVHLELHHVGGIYETMVFIEGGKKEIKCSFQERYTNRTEALKRHKMIVLFLKKFIKRNKLSQIDEVVIKV